MVLLPRLPGVDTPLAEAVATLLRKISAEVVADTAGSPAAVAGAVVVVVTVAVEGAVAALAVVVVAEVRCMPFLRLALRPSASSNFPGHASLALAIEEPHRR